MHVAAFILSYIEQHSAGACISASALPLNVTQSYRMHGGYFAACRGVPTSLCSVMYPWVTALRAIAPRLQAKYMPPLAG